MNPEENEKFLQTVTHGISDEALKDAERFLESTLPLGKGLAKERLVSKAMYVEQQNEYQRKMVENLKMEHEELKDRVFNSGDELKSVAAMRKERNELVRRRKAQSDEKFKESLRSINTIQRKQLETERMRLECQKIREKLDPTYKPQEK